jgi:hypothetical protein
MVKDEEREDEEEDERRTRRALHGERKVRN